jgi:hypothetical protein
MNKINDDVILLISEIKYVQMILIKKDLYHYE